VKDSEKYFKETFKTIVGTEIITL